MKYCIAVQNICGTEPHPVKFRAKKYKIAEKSFGLSDFRQMMSHLPEHVPEHEIIEMFKFADKDRDGRISYEEFLVGFYQFSSPQFHRNIVAACSVLSLGGLTLLLNPFPVWLKIDTGLLSYCSTIIMYNTVNLSW